MYTKNKIGDGFLCISIQVQNKMTFSLPYKSRILQYQYKIEGGKFSLSTETSSQQYK